MNRFNCYLHLPLRAMDGLKVQGSVSCVIVECSVQCSVYIDLSI